MHLAHEMQLVKRAKAFRTHEFCRHPRWAPDNSDVQHVVSQNKVCRTFFQRRRHKDGRRRKVYMIRDAICLLWEVDDTERAIEGGPQATGETDYQPLPHKEQKMDRDCEGFYTARWQARKRGARFS
jgi:hypothetical protein